MEAIGFGFWKCRSALLGLLGALALSCSNDAGRNHLDRVAQALTLRVSNGSGAWSAASTWAGGVVPAAQDLVTIRSGDTVTLDLAVTPPLGGVRVEGTLVFAASQSHELVVDGSDTTSTDVTANNVIVAGTGVLRMRPASASVQHSVHFTNVDESRFAGGGMAPVNTDPGVWVTENGVLDAAGSNKASWTRLQHGAAKLASSIVVDDVSGWQPDDVIVIAPTAKPTAMDATYDEYDKWAIASVNATTKTVSLKPLSGSGSAALAFDHPEVNGKWRAEVLNLTRNVVLRGEPGKRAHVAFMMSQAAQTISNVEISYMGPRKASTVAGDPPGTTLSVLGRYGLHFHMATTPPGTGSVVDGLSLHDLGAHAYVPHKSDNVTIKNSLSHDTFDEAFWWDPNDATNATVWDHDVASLLRSDPAVRGFRLTGFVLGKGNGNQLTNSAAVGVLGNGNAAGFIWPENEVSSVWTFNHNVSHNNKVRGLFVWQNGPHRHIVEDSALYHNQGGGIEHGAYTLRYLFRNLELYGNFGFGVAVHVSSNSPLVSPQTFENLVIDGEGVSSHGFMFLPHTPNVSLLGATLIKNCKVTNLLDGAAVSFLYEGTAAGPGDPGSSWGNHREWVQLVDNDFSVPGGTAKQFWVSGWTDAGTKYGVLPESEIYEQSSSDGQSELLHSIHFTPGFQEQFTTDAAAWPWYWVQQNVVGSLGTTFAGGAGNFTSLAGPVGSVLSYVKTRMAVELDQVVTVSIPNATSSGGLVARRSDTNRESYYKLSAGSHTLTLSKVLEGASTAISTVSTSFDVGISYRVELQVIKEPGGGTRLRGRTWPVGGSVGSWQIDLVDSDPLLDSALGRFGLIAEASSLGSVTVDDYDATILDALTSDNAGPSFPHYTWQVQRLMQAGTPSVKAGKPQSALLPNASVALQASVTDGGPVNPPGLVYTWSKLSGPGAVTFGAPSSPASSVSFASAGTYWLRLTANDGSLVGRGDLRVVVGASQSSGSYSDTFTGTGAWPAPWTSLVSASGSPAVDRTGSEGRVAFTGGSAGVVVNYVNDRSAETVNLLATVKLSANNAAGGLIAHYLESDPDTYLTASIGSLAGSATSGTLRITQVIDGKEDFLDFLTLPDGLANPCASRCKLRFLVETASDGSLDLRVRTWPESGSEPSTWTLEILGWSSPVFSGRRGRYGVVARAGQTNRTVWLDDFSAM